MNSRGRRWMIIFLAFILPVAYGGAMVWMESVSEVVPVIGYFICLLVGGALGMAGCVQLTEPRGRFRVLLAATTLVFASEFIRGLSIFLDVLAHNDDGLGNVTIFMFHGSAFLVFSFGVLIFAGSTRKGKRSGVLTASLGENGDEARLDRMDTGIQNLESHLRAEQTDREEASKERGEASTERGRASTERGTSSTERGEALTDREEGVKHRIPPE